MRIRSEVSKEKLRGGFYSPDVLVDMCLARAMALIGTKAELRILEPSAGDGAFLRGIARNLPNSMISHVEAVELDEAEAEKCQSSMEKLSIRGRVVPANVLSWGEQATSDFDMVLANPPFVRFQFVSDEDKQRAKLISSKLGATGSSVSNLWIPVFLLALDKLRIGGVFSVILPTEFLTGVSASSVRNWLLQNTVDLSIDLFKPGSFPSVLQEVLIISGRKTGKRATKLSTVKFSDHNGKVRSWEHVVHVGLATWTGFLLTPSDLKILEFVSGLPTVKRLGSIARFTVSTVTGANSYFCINRQQVDQFQLAKWTLPLLPRARFAQGLIFSKEDESLLSEKGLATWLLDFAAHKESPEEISGPRKYLEQGIELGIHQRFKCRTRNPWYRVPVVPQGELLLSKRSNLFPRVIANHAGVVTTDTIYRGVMQPSTNLTADDLVASFHSSLTLLSAEIVGRSFGGGVLELVPSEVASLLIPVVPGIGQELNRLDEVARSSSDPEDLIMETNAEISRAIPELSTDILDSLNDARHALASRRIQRTNAKFYE